MSTEDAPAPPPRIGRAGSYSKGIARRQEILDRAIEVFRERGADGTSLRRIAEAIGISHGALLHYFSSREELLVAVYEHAEHRRDLAKPAPERSVEVWPLIDEAIQCYHGDLEFGDMLVAVVEYSQGKLSDSVKAALAERMAFDAANSKGSLQRRAQQILDNVGASPVSA